MYLEVNITLTPFSEELTDILTAELADLGFDTFQTQSSGLLAYIDSQLYNQQHLKLVLSQYGWKNDDSSPITYTVTATANENWNATWEAQYGPVIIPTGKGCVIKPSHKGISLPPLPKSTYRLVLNPDMTFGTGHHPTTFLMAESLLELEAAHQIQGRHVLDFGCGTGILAILAAKMGAAIPVHAVDNSPRAKEATMDNARRNRIPHKLYTICSDGAAIQAGRYQIILANIHRNILLNEMDTFGRALRPFASAKAEMEMDVVERGGNTAMTPTDDSPLTHAEPRSASAFGNHLLLSGFFEEDAPILIESARNQGFTLKEQKIREGWVLLHLIN